MKKWIYKNRFVLIFSLFIFGVSFGIERMTLNMSRLNNIRSILMYIYAKIFLIIFLVVSGLYLKKMICEIRQKQYMRFLIFASILVLHSMILFCIYPGIWIPDTTNILHNILNFETNVFGQGFLTVFVYYTGLMLLPKIVSVLLVQIFLIAMIISKMCTELIYKNKKIIAVCVCLLEVLPPVVFYNLLPMRASLFAHLMLLLFYEVWCAKEKITMSQIGFISLLTALLAVWRFDGLVFLILIPLGCIFLYNRETVLFQKIMMFLIPFCFFIVFKAMILVNLEKGMELSGRIVMINPLSIMLQEELKGDIEKDFEILNEFLDLEKIKENPSAWDIAALYTGEGCLRYDTDKTIGEGLKAYADIIWHNPMSFIRARWKTTMLVETSTFICLPRSEYTMETLEAGTDKEKMQEMKLYNIRNGELRDDMLLGFYKIQPLWRIMGSVIILILGVFVGILRNRCLVVISLAGCIYSMIIFATVPNVWFMYYVPTYVQGGMCLGMIIQEVLQCIKKMRQKEI